MKNKVWFITGASKGLGLSLVKKLLSLGCQVAASSRNKEELKKAVGMDSTLFLPLTISLTDEESVKRGINEAVAYFGRIDVVVNNAGYGLAGALEELSDDEARKNFDINVFGTLNIIRSVLPFLRRQRSGHLFNFSSIGGFNGGFAGFGIYCATKFAVHGLTESLAHEIRDFGIRATVVMPGYFRTNFLNDSSLNVPQNEIPDYKTVRETQQAHTAEINGNQAGDPDKAADVLIKVAEMDQPPVHLFLGKDAYALANAKMDLIKREMKEAETWATSTKFIN